MFKSKRSTNHFIKVASILSLTSNLLIKVLSYAPILNSVVKGQLCLSKCKSILCYNYTLYTFVYRKKHIGIDITPCLSSLHLIVYISSSYTIQETLGVSYNVLSKTKGKVSFIKLNTYILHVKVLTIVIKD